ncbi:Solute carrier family 13 member 5 like protein [Argiope bruennichi]|uniref:Solute carrier family 13 member 5 like protein n=1 Tax=Argiope bruennichi TaxID=94029 RepID=A0A8T0E7J1_ARGBR|nr:Solute carrier family 13 member 5 like protein [Argiope bruennichi]
MVKADGSRRPASSRINIFKYIFGFLIPIILLPLILVKDSKEARCGYVVLLMACYWVVEPIPVAATSLLPVVLFPLLGVITTNEASGEYMNGTNMMFVGGLFMAVAIEECNLHKRIALNVLRWVGPTPLWMIFGFMSTSMFLSMWISNTATAALMVPIIEAVMEEMGGKTNDKDEMIEMKKTSVIAIDVKPVTENGVFPESQSRDSNDPPLPISPDSPNRLHMIAVLKRAMFLSVAYAANIGGTGTLTGTGPNLVVKSVTEKLFPESNDLTFDKWMIFNVPVMLLCVIVAWIDCLHQCSEEKSSASNRQKIRGAGPYDVGTPVPGEAEKENGFITHFFQGFAQTGFWPSDLFPGQDLPFIMDYIQLPVCSSGLVLGVICASFTSGENHVPFHPQRCLNSIPTGKISDATPAIGIPILLFLIPSEPLKLGRSRPLLEWRTIQHKVPWGVIILLGGGFSLALASEKSGLSKWVTQQLLLLNISSPLAVVSLLCIMTAVLTEFTSNVATANVILPVVAELAVAMRIHPMFLMVPVTISCSFAFMLPVATPPNAIVYEAGEMSTLDMLKPGILMNFACVAIEVLMISTYGKVVFDFAEFPSWANSTITT